MKILNTNELDKQDLCLHCENYFADSQLINSSIVYIPSCILKGELTNVEYPLKKCKFFKRKI